MKTKELNQFTVEWIYFWSCWKIVKVSFFNAFYFKNSPNGNFLVCNVYVLVWKYVLLFQNVTTASVSYNSRHLKFGHLLRSEYYHIFHFLAYLEFFVAKFLFKRRKMMYWSNTYSAKPIYTLFRNKSFALNFWS